MRVSCIQLCSSHDIEHNLAQTALYLKQAAEQGAELALLPETFAWIARNQQEKLRCAKKSNMIFEFLAQQAKQHQLWIIAGSVLCPSQTVDKLYNRCPIFAPDGSQHAYYDKIHLFDADLGTEQWQESATIEAGKSPVMIDINANWETTWKAGISICYDLRFPELYRYYSAQDCNILTVAAAFTTPTGKAHWEILLRARAIENQCYVLASAQYGSHSDGRKTYGHSMIIDPWGRVLAQLVEGEGIITAKLDLKKLQGIRTSLPVLKSNKASL